MLNTLIVGAANFVFIFLKAFQQRNVAFLHYGWVVPTSLLMGVVEVGVVGAVAIQATATGSFLALWPLVLAVGIGGGLGAVASMWIHKKIFERKEDAYIRDPVPPVRTQVGRVATLRGRTSGLPEVQEHRNRAPRNCS